MQWDELVLGLVAASTAVAVFGVVQGMERAAARPWQPLGFAGLLFMTAQWLEAAFPGPEFDGFGVDKVFLFVGAAMPLVTCALLARQVTRTRWLALIVDGAVTTAAVLVVTEVLRTPLDNPAGAPEDLRSLVLTYGGYAAVMLGGAGTLCTVSTAALRRSATIMIGAVAAQASAAWFEAMAIVAPNALWTAGSDVAVALGLQAVVLAVHARSAPLHRPHRPGGRARSPARIGIVLVFASLLALPLTIVPEPAQAASRCRAAPRSAAPSSSASWPLRLVLRIREDGRVTEDLVRSEEDFRELIEASSDGLAIMGNDYRLLFTSPAARRLLGIVDPEQDVTLLDLVAAEDREPVRVATENSQGGRGRRAALPRATPATARCASWRSPPPSGAAAAACCTCATSPAAAAASASSSAWPTPTT